MRRRQTCFSLTLRYALVSTVHPKGHPCIKLHQLLSLTSTTWTRETGLDACEGVHPPLRQGNPIGAALVCPEISGLQCPVLLLLSEISSRVPQHLGTSKNILAAPAKVCGNAAFIDSVSCLPSLLLLE